MVTQTETKKVKQRSNYVALPAEVAAMLDRIMGKYFAATRSEMVRRLIVKEAERSGVRDDTSQS